MGSGDSPGSAVRENVNSTKDTPVYPANMAVTRPKIGILQNNMNI